MTTSLPARVAALRDKLGRLESLGSRATEASELSGLRTDLAEPARQFTELTQRKSLFEKVGVPVATPESVVKLRGRAEGLRDKFKAARTSVTLKKGTTWKQMLAEATATSIDVDNALRTAWKDYRSALFAGDPPGKLAGVLAGTPGNQSALDSYKATYDAFTRLFLTLPADVGVVERARSLATELVLIAGRFDFEVKPEVKAFLVAVQAGGAPLALLTPEVLDWLESGNGMDSYRIRAVEMQ